MDIMSTVVALRACVVISLPIWMLALWYVAFFSKAGSGYKYIKWLVLWSGIMVLSLFFAELLETHAGY